MESDLQLKAIPSAESLSSPPRISSSYDDFEQVEQLGSGGNASVYRALHVDGSPEIALKVPHLEGTLSASVIDNFTNEAETWAGIDDHEHVVGIVGWGGDPIPWLAMEYMDGGSMRTRVGEVDLVEGLWIMYVVSKAIQHASTYGIAHLDLKPENILFKEMPAGQWDVPKVADWGLAKQLLDGPENQAGLSVQYAAPEQFESEAPSPDNRTDIYQLGVVAYELFTGTPPFDGNDAEVVDAIRNEKPAPPSRHDGSIPQEMDDVVLTALAKDPEDRQEDVLYFRDDVKKILDAEIGGTDTSTSRGTASTDSTTGTDSAREGATTREADEKFCRTCGELIKKEAEICPECGVRQDEAGKPSTAGEQTTQPAGGTTQASTTESTQEVDEPVGNIHYIVGLGMLMGVAGIGMGTDGVVLLLLSFPITIASMWYDIKNVNRSVRSDWNPSAGMYIVLMLFFWYVVGPVYLYNRWQKA